MLPGDNNANYSHPYPMNTTGHGNSMNQQNQSTAPIQGTPGRYNNAPQQNVRPFYIPGKMIMSENDIFPSEVPMDGSFGTFIQQDLSRVYIKTWGTDGLIHTNVYELANPGSSKVDPIQIIMARLDNIEKAIKENRPQKSSKRNPSYANQNKNGQSKEE